PLPGYDRLRSRVRPEIIDVLQKAIQLDPKQRFDDAVQMHAAFVKAQSTARKQKRTKSTGTVRRGTSWRRLQWREFQRQFKSELDTRHHCRRCEGPVSESMQFCPWCGFDHPSRGSESRMPSSCPRCERGVKKDWDYCAWCYGPGFVEETSRTYPDKRYSTRCEHKRCRGPLMPFMRYCPWCRKKVRRVWKLKGSRHKCNSCQWGIAHEFWNFCAWCREPVKRE
ncbi:MAG TPA: zinc ribbon domain-containing protein, partial [Woeseiaceae bacterium]|nr:zinc ribbon domain-containing protein [Woeseiaceae bacterium]